MALSPARSILAAEERLDDELSAHQLCASDFVDPDLQSPLDVEARLAQTPSSAGAKGMFFEQLARSARRSGVACEARYVPFRDYPLQDFMRLLTDYARARFPKLPLREAFRRVGWDAFPTLMNSVAGKVIFAFARGDAHGVLRLAPDGYKHSLSHCKVSLRVSSPGQVVLEYRDVWNFPECYHVGVVEGACRAFGSEARVRTRVLSPCNVDMLIRW
jgi:uncharacterized protein (TIGR02265 family)